MLWRWWAFYPSAKTLEGSSECSNRLELFLLLGGVRNWPGNESQVTRFDPMTWRLAVHNIGLRSVHTCTLITSIR